jgi:GDP-mannose 6-dehydrogenase
VVSANPYEPKVDLINKDYILNHIPHISALMVDGIDEVLGHADTTVIGNVAQKFRTVAANIPAGKSVLDLVKLIDQRSSDEDGYDGICG